MQESSEILNYFKTLKRIIDTETVFKFFNRRFVRQDRIVDVMCCIYATLPESYSKKMKRTKGVVGYKSILAFEKLLRLLSPNFKFSKNIVIISYEEVLITIDKIMADIESDINIIERMS